MTTATEESGVVAPPQRRCPHCNAPLWPVFLLFGLRWVCWPCTSAKKPDQELEASEASAP